MQISALFFFLPLIFATLLRKEGCSGNFCPGLSCVGLSFCFGFATDAVIKANILCLGSPHLSLSKTQVLGLRWLPRLVRLFGEMGEALPQGISAQQNPFATAWLSLLSPEGAEAPPFEMCPTI